MLVLLPMRHSFRCLADLSVQRERHPGRVSPPKEPRPPSGWQVPDADFAASLAQREASNTRCVYPGCALLPCTALRESAAGRLRQRRLPCAQAAFQIILHDATGGAVAGARSSGQPVRRAGRVE